MPVLRARISISSNRFRRPTAPPHRRAYGSVAMNALHEQFIVEARANSTGDR